VSASLLKPNYKTILFGLMNAVGGLDCDRTTTNANTPTESAIRKSNSKSRALNERFCECLRICAPHD
jgi:hypothetical protein